MSDSSSTTIADVLVLSDAGVWGTDDERDGVSVLRSTNFRDDGEISFETPAIKSIEPRDRSESCSSPAMFSSRNPGEAHNSRWGGSAISEDIVVIMCLGTLLPA
jgi:hypothetical protein